MFQRLKQLLQKPQLLFRPEQLPKLQHSLKSLNLIRMMKILLQLKTKVLLMMIPQHLQFKHLLLKQHRPQLLLPKLQSQHPQSKLLQQLLQQLFQQLLQSTQRPKTSKKLSKFKINFLRPLNTNQLFEKPSQSLTQTEMEESMKENQSHLQQPLDIKLTKTK